MVSSTCRRSSVTSMARAKPISSAVIRELGGALHELHGHVGPGSVRATGHQGQGEERRPSRRGTNPTA
jgi:hypothetical protein